MKEDRQAPRSEWEGIVPVPILLACLLGVSVGCFDKSGKHVVMLCVSTNRFSNKHNIYQPGGGDQTESSVDVAAIKGIRSLYSRTEDEKSEI